MNAIALPPWKFAEPSIWRRYHSAEVSVSYSATVNFSAPSGKWPQKMTALLHRLRTTLAVALAVRVDTNAGPVSSGKAT